MNLSAWLSASLRRLNARERRVVLGGAALAAAALALALLVLPFARRWSARETTFAATRDQWARLSGLAAGTERLRQGRDAQDLAQSAERAWLVDGATPALAASNLQALLQRYAAASAVQLDRVDVAGQPRAHQAGLLAIPALLQGQGDLYGLVDFLGRIEGGERLLVIDDLSVNTGAWGADGRQMLLWSVRLHGLHRPAEGKS